jgi:hypothetical protein
MRLEHHGRTHQHLAGQTLGGQQIAQQCKLMRVVVLKHILAFLTTQ